jgi:hypothetical protein
MRWFSRLTSRYGVNTIGILVWKHLDGRHAIDDVTDIACERPKWFLLM